MAAIMTTHQGPQEGLRPSLKSALGHEAEARQGDHEDRHAEGRDRHFDSGRWFAFVLVACAVVCCNRLTPQEHEPLPLDSVQPPQAPAWPLVSDTCARSTMLPGANRSMKPSTAARRDAAPSPGAIRACSP
jgi:hypothetical protein